MGVSTAYWLARAGMEVLILEGQELAWGASGRNVGLMLHAYRPLEDPKLVLAVLAEEDIEADYAKPGHLAIAGSEAIWEKICEESFRRRNTPAPVYALDLSACEDLLGMRLNRKFLGGRWWPQGRLIHPVRFVYGLAWAASRHGAGVLTRVQVERLEAIAGRECFALHTNRGILRARQVVFACNNRLLEFAPDFRKYIRAVVSQVMATAPLPQLFRIGLALDWGTVYWRQAPDGAIVLGGYGTTDTPFGSVDSAGVNTRIQKALSDFLPDTFPGFPAFSVRHRWAGVMDCPVDSQPMIGAMPGIPNQWIIAGFGGHGMPAGLGAGKALAEAVVTGQTPGILQSFDPGRFTTH